MKRIIPLGTELIGGTAGYDDASVAKGEMRCRDLGPFPSVAEDRSR